MSLSVVFQDGKEQFGPYQLASANGWKLVGEWAEEVMSLPLRDLVFSGEVKDTEMLALTIKVALDRRPPDSDEVKHTVSQLLSRIGVGSASEVARIIS